MTDSSSTPTLPSYKDVKSGDVWRHRKTKRTCTVRNDPRGVWDNVMLEHESGRKTTKGVHYFLYDFERVTPEGS